MCAWTRRFFNGKAAQEIVPPRPRIPWWKGPGADSEEKHEPASDIDIALMDSLKVLDPEGPIREADIVRAARHLKATGSGAAEARGAFASLRSLDFRALGFCERFDRI